MYVISSCLGTISGSVAALLLPLALTVLYVTLLSLVPRLVAYAYTPEVGEVACGKREVLISVWLEWVGQFGCSGVISKLDSIGYT